MHGAESILVYTSQSKPSLIHTSKELIVFLKALHNQAVKSQTPIKDLAYSDDNNHKWVIKSDKFTIHVATSANDVKNSVTMNEQY